MPVTMAQGGTSGGWEEPPPLVGLSSQRPKTVAGYEP